MAASRCSVRIMLFIVLVLSSFLIIGCEGQNVSVFIKNQSNDNFRIGGPDGPHIEPSEQRFLCNLYQFKNAERLSYSVELWRRGGCVSVLSVNKIVSDGDYVSYHIDAVVTISGYEPPFTATVDTEFIMVSTANCP